MFVFRMLLDMNRSGIHLAFIDFSKACNNVNRNGLYAKLISHGVSSKFLKIIESMYTKINSKARTGKWSKWNFLTAVWCHARGKFISHAFCY